MEAAAQRPRSQVTVKTVLTVTAVTLAVAAAAFIVVKGNLALAFSVTSALVAISLHHAVDWLVKRRLRRALALSLVLTAFLSFFVALGLLLIPPAISQGRQLIVQGPALVSKVRETSVYQKVNPHLNLDARLEQLRQRAPALAEEAVNPALKAVSGALAGATAFITLFFLVAFMLAFGGKLVQSVLAEATPERRPRYERVVSKIYRSVGGYVTGLSVVCGVNAVATTIMLAILRVPFFLPLGIVAGLSSLIPLAGNTIAGIAISAIALLTGGVVTGAIAAVFFILYQQFENHVLGPLVYRRTVNLNPLVIILAVLFMTEVFGVIGAILAVPLVAALQIVVRELLAFRRQSLNLPPPHTAAAPEPQEPAPAQP